MPAVINGAIVQGAGGGVTLFVSAPLAGMGFRSPLLTGGLLGVLLALTIVIVSPGDCASANLSGADRRDAVLQLYHPDFDRICKILPLHPIVRSLASLESVLGQLYLTVLLARLVAMHGEARRNWFVV